MSSGTDIIKEALAEIGVSSVVSPPAPESVEAGRKKLNSMLEMWLSRNIVIGTTPLDVAGDELNEPEDCRNAIVYNLALHLSPSFANGRQIVSPELRSNARSELSMVKSLYGRVVIPQKVLSSNTPTGRSSQYENTFWHRGKRVGN